MSKYNRNAKHTMRMTEKAKRQAMWTLIRNGAPRVTVLRVTSVLGVSMRQYYSMRRCIPGDGTECEYWDDMERVVKERHDVE